METWRRSEEPNVKELFQQMKDTQTGPSRIFSTKTSPEESIVDSKATSAAQVQTSCKDAASVLSTEKQTAVNLTGTANESQSLSQKQFKFDVTTTAKLINTASQSGWKSKKDAENSQREMITARITNSFQKSKYTTLKDQEVGRQAAKNA